MARVILGMTQSLDGYIEDRAGSVAALYSDFDQMTESEPLQEAIRDTGAVVMGRHAFQMADDPDSYADTYEFQVPIFVVTHTAPQRKPRENDRLTFTFVTSGLTRAVQQAKAAAGSKDVYIIGGASIAQQCLTAGLVDELHVDVMPVLLTGGIRLFDGLGSQPVQLERLKVVEIPGGRTHLRYRIVR